MGGAARSAIRAWVTAALLLLLFAEAAVAGTGLRGGRGLTTTPFADTLAPGAVELGVWGQAFHDGSDTLFVASPMALTFGITERTELALSAEILARSDPVRRPGMLDPARLTTRYRFADETPARPGFAINIAVERGDRGADFRSSVGAQKSFHKYKTALALGWVAASGRSASGRRAATLQGGAEATFDEWAVALEADGRLEETESYRRGNVVLGTRINWNVVAPNLDIGIGAQIGLGPHTADHRLLVGLTYSTAPERMDDRDDDKVVDPSDRCLFEPEDINEYEDEDGCPEGGPPASEEVVAEREFTTPRPRFRMRIPVLTLSSARRTPRPPGPVAPGEPARESEPATPPVAAAPKRRGWEPLPASSPKNPLRIPAARAKLVRGDNLWNLAGEDETLGDSRLWPVLYLANAHRVRRESVIRTGAPLLMPTGLAVPPRRIARDFFALRRRLRARGGPPPGAVSEVTTVAGDTLRKISARPEVYGDARFWTLLYAANLDRAGTLGAIEPGTVLRVRR